MSGTVNNVAIRKHIERLSNRIRPNQYWVSDPNCSNFAYDLKPHSFFAIYLHRFDLEINAIVKALPPEARLFHKYSVNAYFSYNTWAIAYDHADRLLQELRERDVHLAYLFFYDSQGKIGSYSEEFAELLTKYWDFV